MKTILRTVLTAIIVPLLMGCNGNDKSGGQKPDAFADSTFVYMKNAREAQNNGNFDLATDLYMKCIASVKMPSDTALVDTLEKTAVGAIVQLMNTFQSKGEPEACVECFDSIDANLPPFIAKYCKRTFYATMAYALSRTEELTRSVELADRVLTMDTRGESPYDLFIDYTYCGSVYYSESSRQTEAKECFKKGMEMAELCGNPSGAQYLVTCLAMMYRREGEINESISLFEKSVSLAKSKGDLLGEANSYNSMVELLLFWGLADMANSYADKAMEAIADTTKFTDNPMVRGQVYIYKGLVMKDMGKRDSAMLYLRKASDCIASLPYNSGLVDIELTMGEMLIGSADKDSVAMGKALLDNVAANATERNKGIAQYRLARYEMARGNTAVAESLLDSVYDLSQRMPMTLCVSGAYEMGLNHYLEKGDNAKAAKFAKAYMEEMNDTENRITVSRLTDVMVSHFMENKEMKMELEKTRIRQRGIILIVVSVAVILLLIALSVIAIIRLRLTRVRKRLADERLQQLTKELEKTYISLEKERENNSQLKKEMDEMMNEMTPPEEVKLLEHDFKHKGTPSDFYRHFNKVYPFFLKNLRSQVPGMGTRMETFCMLLVLNQTAVEISELLNIEIKSVNMMKYRLRQKLNLKGDETVEDYIKSLTRRKPESV